MYDDRLEIVSPGGLHFGLHVEDLLKPHESRPWNPIMASVFYRAGIIEKWGIGTLEIIDWCKEGHTPPPQWREQDQYLYIIFYPTDDFEKPDISEHVTGEVTGEVEKFLQIIEYPMSRQEMQGRLGLKGEENFRRLYPVPVLNDGLIEMTIPDKPKSRFQKYRLTVKGREILRIRKNDR